MTKSLESLKNATMRLIKAWRALEAAQKDLDYKKSEWAREVRSLAPTDAKFIDWCSVELRLTQAQAKELLDRAATLAIVPDVKTWNTHGGFQKLRKLVELPKKEQVAVIEAAKVSGHAISTVLQQRGHVPTSAPVASVLVGPAADAAALAAFIRGVIENGASIVVTREIRALLRRYPAPAALKAVA